MTAKTTKTAPKTKAKTTKRPRHETPPEKLARLLRRANGVHMDDLVDELKVQRHTIRAMISAQRKLGRNVELVEKSKYRMVV